MTTMSEPQTFTKKPVSIYAIQYSQSRPVPTIEWLVRNDVEHIYECTQINIDTLVCEGGAEGHELYIVTLEGKMRVSDGDWVIQGVKGEFYPCKDGIFRETYDEDFE